MLGPRGVAAAATTFALLVLTGCAPGAQPASERECARSVIDDWTDGTIDRTFPAQCYLAALDALPEDLRAYTTARDDIVRALQSSARSTRARTPGKALVTDTQSASSSAALPLAPLALGSFAVVVLLAGSAGFAVRRLRRDSS